jgi:hypothetical protein
MVYGACRRISPDSRKMLLVRGDFPVMFREMVYEFAHPDKHSLTSRMRTLSWGRVLIIPVTIADPR